jgi:hypothetical protein
MLKTWCIIAVGVVIGMSAASLPAADYARDIKPVFKARCYACHGALKQEAGLRLDTVESMRTGGDSGAAITPGDAATSRLIERISAPDLESRMPPEGMPLSPEEIAKISEWIQAGAAGPPNEQPEPDPRSHWAFQVPRRAPIPAAAGDNPIDAFLHAKIRERNLAPRPLASREHQFRRLHLDLIGLPPTPADLHEFLADNSPDAWERTVDRLLNDPRHGERWARHWMDIWRYSDWYGRRDNDDVRNSASQIWRWRDWIVDSVNADKGYGRMLQEMLAADEIAPEDEAAAVATGYLIRNYYSLNPNDWMRNIVEHTGKGFLGLTFNCAHCHDHKYDPISQDNYFQLRAVFEPIFVRQDRIPGQPDPGKFLEYDYGGSRAVQRLGLVRIFDKSPDAVTWFYTGGDERNRVKDRGSIPPGVPTFLTGESLAIQPVTLPPEGWYPGLQEGLQQSVLNDARAALEKSEQQYAAAQAIDPTPDPAAVEALRIAEAEFEAAKKESASIGPLSGKQSLVLDAAAGRRIVHNGLQTLTELPNGSRLEFDVLLLADAHFNFQFAKDIVAGLTAGYVAWDHGKIVSYQPGSFTEFTAGNYDFAKGQRRFHVEIALDLPADNCKLSIRSVADDKLLVDQALIALNGWNPVGDPKKAITFDARTGSLAMIDAVQLTTPTAEGTTAAPLAAFDFEPPEYQNGRDLAGMAGWTISTGSIAPATSVISEVGVDPKLRELSRAVEAKRRIVELPAMRLKSAELARDAAVAHVAAVETRIETDRMRYGPNPPADIAERIRAAGQAERQAAVLQAEAEVLAQQAALDAVLAKPANDANRGKEIEAATAKLTAARTALEQARAALANESLAETYTPLTPTYPATSTGRRKALAEWITSPEQPLTARVAVNHIWARHFHAAIVTSVFDFGRNGATPTHPELLDWLAVDLRESDWSMKRLHRLIVTSTAYRRTSAVGDATANVEIDPENRYLWRMNAGRMEAEVVRDSLLACAKRLEPTIGGQELENTQALTTFRRTLYYSHYGEGGGRGKLGELFDAPDPLDCYRRTESIIPQQALALTNSDLIHQMSAAIIAEPELAALETDAFITAMFERILSRPPTAMELEICRESLASDGAEARESLIRALFNHNDFIAIR